MDALTQTFPQRSLLIVDITCDHVWFGFSFFKDPRAKLCILMGKTNTSGPKHLQQSMILVPMDAPGVKIVRHLGWFFVHPLTNQSIIH
jgi:hypothetical protein